MAKAALRWPRTRGPLVVLVALLAACGGGGGGGDAGVGPGGTVQPPPPDGTTALNAYFPTTAGSRWYYERTNLDGARGQLAVEVAGTAVVAGRTVTVFTSTDALDQATETAYFSTTADGVREHSGPGSDANGTGLESYVLLRLPASTPAPYLSYDVAVPNPPDVDGDGRPDATRLRSVVRTAPAGAPVVTRAGRFDDCVLQHVETTATISLSKTSTTLVVNQVSDDWYARDVGFVKSVVATSSQGRTFNEEVVLDAYVVADVRSEQVRPTVLVPTAPPSPVRGAGLEIVVKFSEPMYAPSLTGGAVALLDAQGARVPGHVAIAGDEARFKPDATLPSGSYRVAVDTRASDLVGNALATPAQWTVLVDSDAPGVLATVPADGATGVRPDVAIQIQMSEPPSGALGTGAVRLVDAQGQPIAAQVGLNGATIVVQPLARLQAGATYVIQAGPGFNDAYGNVSNTTVQARFTVDTDGQAPRLLRMDPPDGSVEVAPDTPLRLYFDEPLAGQADALIVIEGTTSAVPADITVVGTMLTLTPRSPMPQDTLLRITARVSDGLGNFAEQPAQHIRTLTSRFDPVATLALDAVVTATDIADLNGDGLNDQALVTGAPTGFSGLQTYRLLVRLGLPGGGRSDPAAVPLPAECRMDQVQVVDLDGDARKDVLVSGWGCGVWVYPQLPGGGLGSPQRLPGLDFLQVLARDMNGDGHSELVGVKGGQLAVWYRSADGAWSAGATATLGGYSARHFAVGDVDGDGRPDVVVALDLGPIGPQLMVYPQAADGSFAAARTLTVPDRSVAAVAIGDVNGDGRADVVVTAGGNLPRALLGVWPQQADGSLGTLQSVPVYEVPMALLLADIDNDGKLDVVIEHLGYFRVGVLLQKEGRLLTELLYPARSETVPPAGDFAAGDLDGNGRTDLVIGPQVLLQRAAPPAPTGRPSARPLRILPPSPGRLRLLPRSGLLLTQRYPVE